ncbi:putative phosphatidate phosphatase [Ceratitis capitata]|uniref:putative phosphatidate phosphatase n=1 Tax=Ceratitis capitata TaxID=7213 RepID=UPI0006188B51|nr:putative phosphatidate phosphatase [Ceratitis capitata]
MCKTPSSRLLQRLIIDVVILIALCCVALVALPKLLPTTRRGFFCSDTSLRYPYTASLLNRVHITIAVIALPAAVMLVVEMLWAAVRAARKTNPGNANGNTVTTGAKRTGVQQFIFVGINIPTFVSECYKIVGVYFFGLALVLIALRATKNFVGRLRPYFFDVCQPQLLETLGSGLACERFDVPKALNASTITGGYIEDYECYELAASAELLSMARQSFPSGYTSTVCYAMFFIVFYLQARLAARVFLLLKTLLQFGFVMLAALVAIERFYTHHNHWTDILAGGVLGFILAAFATIAVADLFKQLPVKKRKTRDDSTRIYGYYGVNRVSKYY